MPSEYQKWIARDVKKEVPKELTRQEKRANWWYYHWWQVVLCVLAVIVVCWILADVIEGKNNQPDCQIAYIGTKTLPTDTVKALEEHLSPLIGDVDGNGKVILQINQYIVSLDNVDYASDDVNQQIVMVSQLSMNENVIFLLEDPVDFQKKYELLIMADGSHPGDSTGDTQALWYSWEECPVLAELPLGNYEIDYGGEAPIVGSNQELLANLYIARGGVYNHTEDDVKTYTQIWEHIIEGVRHLPMEN